jgi:predicted transcriptional regulator
MKNQASVSSIHPTDGGRVRTAASGRGRWIERVEQVRALESTVCQEIVDLVGAAGPCSVREMAGFMGRRPDSLYYHVRKLSAAGLLVDRGIRGSGRRAEAVYDVPGRPLRLAYAPSDPENVEAVGRVIASMLRSANRDFHGGFRPGLAVVEGDARNLWAARMKGWLSDDDVAELNALLNRILEVFHPREAADIAGRETRPADGGSRRLHSLTWVLAPMDTAPGGGKREAAS